MNSLRNQVIRAASVSDPVLIYGETGTGKELIARAIYKASRTGAFVVVDCSGISSALIESELFGHVRGAFTGAVMSKTGLLELANGGTLFLDEVGELPLDLQAKFLRVLQEKEVRAVGSNQIRKVSFRVIAATNRNLSAEVGRGRFREDLYYRLNVLKIETPALRTRTEDVPALVEHFLRERASTSTLTSDALRVLKGYHWPGNVRELQNCVARMTTSALENTMGLSDLPRSIYHTRAQESRPPAEFDHLCIDNPGLSIGEEGRPKTLAGVEKQAIISVLKSCNGDRRAAANLLGIGRTTLYRKLREYGFCRGRSTKPTHKGPVSRGTDAPG